jgi:hypothetical protein
MVDIAALAKANGTLLGLGTGLLAALRPLRSIWLGRRSLAWARRSAVVTVSAVDRESNIYYPNVIYAYSVGGREYTDGTYSFAKGDAATKQWCTEFVQRHPVGATIQIYVNPEEPSESVIEPGVHWSAYRNVVLLVLLFVALGAGYQWQGSR